MKYTGRLSPRFHTIRQGVLSLGFIAALALAPAAQSATRTWDGDTSSAWSNSANWNTLPASSLTTDTALFNLAAYDNVTVFNPDAGTRSIAGITIGASNGAMTLSGTNLSIGATGITITAGAGALTFSPTTVTIGANQTWTNNSGNAMAVNVTNLTRGSGGFLLNLAGAGGFSTSTLTNTNNVLGGPWVTFGNDYATVSGGNIVALNVAASSEATWNDPADNYTLAGADTLTGSRTANTLRYTGNAQTLDLGANSLALNGLLNGGSDKLTIAGAGPLAIGATGELVIIANQAIDIAPAITGSGILTKGGAATVALTGASTFGGHLRIQAGTFDVSNANQNISQLSGAGGTLAIGNKTLTLTTSVSDTFSGGISLNGGSFVANVANTFTQTLGSAIVGTGGIQDTITKQGAGTLSLVAPTFQASDNDRINIEAGTLALSGTPANTRINFLTNGVTLNSGSTFSNTNTLNFAANGVLTSSSSSNPTFSNVFTGTGSITITGGQFVSAYLTPSASSDWTGNLIAGTGGRATVRIGNGNLNYNPTGNPGSTPKGISLLTLTGAGTAGTFTNPDLGDSGNSGQVRIRADVTVGGLNTAGNGINTRLSANGVTSNVAVLQTLTINTATTQEYQGILSNGFSGGNGGNQGAVTIDLSTLKLVKTGVGTQTISGQTYLQNYSGGTDINGGTLIVTGGGAAVSKTLTSATVTNGSTGTFALADTSGLYVGKAVNGFTNVFISAVTTNTSIQITNRSGSSQTILASSTFNASSPTGTGPVVVNGGTLGGNGFILGATTINSGGTVSPGNSIGTMSIASDLALLGTYKLELAGDNISDLILVGGIANLSGGQVDVFTLGGYSPTTAGQSWVILTANGGFANAAVLTSTSPDYFTRQAGTNLELVSTIPEPSSILLVATGLGFLTIFRRRRM